MRQFFMALLLLLLLRVSSVGAGSLQDMSLRLEQQTQGEPLLKARGPHLRRGVSMISLTPTAFGPPILAPAQSHLSSKAICDLSATVDRAVVGSAEPVVLDLSIHNTGSKDILYFESSPEWQFIFSVKDSSGRAMPLTRYGAKLSSPRVFTRLFLTTLPPGEERHFRILINRMFDMSVPDAYVVSASTVVGVGNIQNPVSFTSQPIQVEVSGFDSLASPCWKPKASGAK